LNDLDLCLEVV